jgi:nucleoid DNA-binding protein
MKSLTNNQLISILNKYFSKILRYKYKESKMANKISRKELIKEIAKELDIEIKMTQSVIDMFESKIVSNLEKGNDVELTGFCSFKTTLKEEATKNFFGKEVVVPAHRENKAKLSTKIAKMTKDNK